MKQSYWYCHHPKDYFPRTAHPGSLDFYHTMLNLPQFIFVLFMKEHTFYTIIVTSMNQVSVVTYNLAAKTVNQAQSANNYFFFIN